MAVKSVSLEISAVNGFRFLGNSLEVHAEETEQDSPEEDSSSTVSRLEIKKSNITLKERKRNKTDDEETNSQKVLCEIPNKNTDQSTITLRAVVPGANSELVEKAKVIVEKAIKQHKVYVMFGQYGTVRRALKRRGWLEKPCDCCRVSR